jgi:hypothetical protein
MQSDCYSNDQVLVQQWNNMCYIRANVYSNIDCEEIIQATKEQYYDVNEVIR